MKNPFKEDKWLVWTLSNAGVVVLLFLGFVHPTLQQEIFRHFIVGIIWVSSLIGVTMIFNSKEAIKVLIENDNVATRFKATIDAIFDFLVIIFLLWHGMAWTAAVYLSGMIAYQYCVSEARSEVRKEIWNGLSSR